MAKEKIISIGQYMDWDIEPLRRDYDLIELADSDSVLGLDAADAASVRAIAFKGHHPIGGAHFDHLKGLEIVVNFGVGYDAIDVAAASARGIRVTNTPDVLNDDVADLALGMALSLSRDLPGGADWLASGNWSGTGKEYMLTRKLSGRRAGIVGMGRIGREIANRLAAFKCEIHYTSRAPKDTPAGWTHHSDPVSMARAVDDLYIALVGGEATRGLVSAEVIGALGADGLIVNISRGTTVDEDALIKALEEKRIRGAALDVFLNEPKIDKRFYALENVHLQPHVASGTVETRKAMGQLQRDNLAAHFAGRALLTPVN